MKQISSWENNGLPKGYAFGGVFFGGEEREATVTVDQLDHTQCLRSLPTSPSGGPHCPPRLPQHLTAIPAPADREQAAKHAQTLGCIPLPTHPAPNSCKTLAQSSPLNRRPFSPFVMTYYPFRWFVFRPSSQLFSCLHWTVGKISGARRGYNACNATQTD